MKIDVKKLGYRWKGNHTATASYERGDVVRMKGVIKYHDGSNFVTMVDGQNEMLIKGALAANNTAAGFPIPVAGLPDMILGVGNGVMEFQFSDGRNSTAVRKLAKTLGGRYGGCEGRAGHQTMFAIMTDGTVRCWGDNSNSKLGVGIGSQNATLPEKVAFPTDAAPIVEVYAGSHYSNAAIDAKGVLWGWGYNGLYQMGKEGDTTIVYTPEKINGRGDIPEDAVIVDFFQTSVAGDNYSTIYISNWALDSKGNLYGWGSNTYGMTGVESTETTIQKPTLVPLSQDVNIKKVISFGNRIMASFFITDVGHMYEVGARGSIASDNAYLTATDSRPALWNPSTYDPVKKVVWSQGRYSTTTSSYYDRRMLLTENGKIYTWGDSVNGLVQTDVPTYLNTRLAAHDSRIDDVKDCGVKAGIGQSQYVLKNDGTVWGIGYVTDIDPSDNTIMPSLYNVWTQLNYGSDNSEMIVQGDVGSAYNQYYAGILLKKNDGTLFITGYWRNGLSYTGGGNDQNSNNQKAFSIVRLPKAVDEYEILGGDNMNCLFSLIDGVLYSAGWGYALGNEDNNTDRYTMSQVIF